MVLSMVISMLSVGYHICNDVNLDGFVISQGAGEVRGRFYGLNSSLLEGYFIHERRKTGNQLDLFALHSGFHKFRN